jgi:hypothetical protein
LDTSGPLGPACSFNAEFYPHIPCQAEDRINALHEHADLFVERILWWFVLGDDV